MRALRAIGLLGGLAALGLLPLYGDPKPSALVAHPEWARMVLRGLGLLTAGRGVNETAGQVFATLSGRDSRSFPADRYVRASRLEVSTAEGSRRVRPVGGIGQAVYALNVARPGEYRLRLDLAATTPAEAEVTRAGDDAVLRRFAVAASPTMAWVDAGAVHLEPGAYDATVLLPEGSSLEYVEIAPPCVHPIEPPGGWKPSRLTSTEDVAVTVLQALDLESELPPSAPALEFRATDLRNDDGSAAVDSTAASASFRAGARGSRVLLAIDVPEAGLYTLSVFGIPSGGQRWLADGCRSCLVCPANTPTPEWRTILTGWLHRGRHLFAANLGAETVVERLRLEPKKASPADYVGALERLGLALGPAGPVTRDRAEEARRFLERRRADQSAAFCGDVPRGRLVAELATSGAGPAASGPSAGPVGPAAPSVNNPPPNAPVPPPIVPPLPPGSPTLP